jgi:glyoxylase-like metal-dependent hydrolase (beta-lactamase superfamily II)
MSAAAYTVITLPVGSLDTNCYLVAARATGVALCIDPGADAAGIARRAQQENMTVQGIALTHGHGDHIGAVARLRKEWNVPVYIHTDDADMLTSAARNLSVLLGAHIETDAADATVDDDTTLTFGDTTVRVLHTPGHTPGGVCYFIGAATPPLLFSGDTLFQREVGRCDLAGGRWSALQRSIREKLYVLPAATCVFPGHGPATTIAEEMQENPHVRAEA